MRPNWCARSHHDLHAVDARRKRGDHELPGRRREDLLERVLDLELGTGEPFAIDVRAVAKQRQHARAAELRESMHVEVLAVDRRLIDLEVARVHERAGRRVNRQRDAVGHAVRDAQELDLAVADANALPRLNGNQPVARIDAVLVELGPQQRERQRRAVHRSVDQRPDVRHAADVILVPVRQEQRGRARLALLADT